MPIPWEDFINGIKDEAGKLAKAELINMVKSAKDDSEEFLRKQGEKLEKYLDQLANGQISKEEFEGYMKDILLTLPEIKALEVSVAAKARAQRLVEGITDLILDKLISLIK